MTMGKAVWGKLTEAWPGEAKDFTPKLAERLGLLGDAVGLPLLSGALTEVASTGGRRIDIVGADSDETVYVIENQYGAADHDHLTRGLAYAVAKSAKGLIVVAEKHRDEFREVAEYLNNVAVRSGEIGIKVWLVEARAIKVDDSPWAPIFDVVVSPNSYVEAVARQSSGRRTVPVDEFIAEIAESVVQPALHDLKAKVATAGWKFRANASGIGIWSKGPGQTGERAIISIYPNGSLLVPFGAYRGVNSGIEIAELITTDFVARTDRRFELRRTKDFGTSPEGWLTVERVTEVMAFWDEVAAAYQRFVVPDVG